MKRSKKWKRCFRQASRHRKTHAGFDRALHACLARSFGEVAHDPTTVWGAVYRGKGRLAKSRGFAIKVEIHRDYRGLFSAHACIPKGSMRVIGGPLLRRLAPRCGGATAATPTRALRGALAKLTRKTR